MGSFHVWEVMSQLNKRTTVGRVVVNPPKKMPPLALKKGAEKWFLCKCGRGFNDRDKFNLHKTTHPGDFTVDWSTRRGLPSNNNYSNNHNNEGIMHSCMHCGKVLQSASALRNHIYIHTGEKPWKCDKCPAVFRLYSTLYDHRRVSHVVGGKFKCPQCPCRFQAQLGLRRHLGIYHSTAANVKNASVPILNPKTINNKVNSKGVIASTASNSKKRITTTVVQTDGTRTYPCSYCGKVFYKSQYLRNHLPVHTGERRSVCHLCGVGFKSSSNLLAHKKVSHVDGGKHKCERCTCIFASLLGLVRHRRLLHGIGKTPVLSHKMKRPKLVKAPMHFLAGFASEDGEEEEEEDSQEEEEENETGAGETFDCEECGKVLATAAGLRNHLMIHSGEKPWICNICGLSFRLNSTLYGHKKSSHVPNGPYKCDICPCTFAALFGLRRHKICFHDAAETTVEPLTKVKSSKCQYCKKVFKSTNILHHHLLLVHRNEKSDKPVKCPKCASKYTTTRSLRKHTKTAHVPGGKKCPKCPCSFATLQARKSHHTKVHTKGNIAGLKVAVAKVAKVKTTNGAGESEDDVKSASESHLCERCNKAFNSQASLKNHLRYCSQQNIQCDLCHEGFSIYSNMIRHKRSCHVPNGPYKCNQCTHCYATTRGISRHMAHAHSLYSKEKGHNSGTQVVSRKNSLPALQMKPSQAVHRIIQNSKKRDAARKRKPYEKIPDILRKHKCSICGNAFSSSGNYKKHLETSHVPGGKYPCLQCACVFNTYNALNSHAGNRHASSKKMEPKPQASPKVLSQKRPATLSPQKQIIPPLSKIKFNFFRPSISTSASSVTSDSPPTSAVIKRKPTQLLKRMALIVGGNTSSPHESSPEPPTPPRISSPTVELKEMPVPFTTASGVPKCETCGKIYSNMATLRNHLTVHTGEKPFPCDLCGLRFRQKGDVVSHKKTNHTEGKYRCALCPCRFVSTHGFKRHMIHAHGKNKQLSQSLPVERKVAPKVQAPAIQKVARGKPLASIMKVEKKEPVEYGKVTLAFAKEIPKMNSSKDDRRFNCELCDASFNHIQNLLRHRKSSHVPWGEHKCSFCSCSFVSSTSLRTHQAIFHQIEKKSGKHMRSAVKPKRGVKLPAQASQSFSIKSSSRENVDEEMEDDLGDLRVPKMIRNNRGKKVYLCQLCGASFNSHGNAVKHIQNSHVDNGEYACHKCTCIFANFKGLTRHESIYHASGNKGAKRQLITPSKNVKMDIEDNDGDAEDSYDENYGHFDDDDPEGEANDTDSSLKNEPQSEAFDANFEDEEECLLLRGNELPSNEVDPLDTSSSQDEDDKTNDIKPSKLHKSSKKPTQGQKLQEVTIGSFSGPDLKDLQARIPSLSVTKVDTDDPPPEKSIPRPHSTVFGDGGVLQKERVNRFAIYAKKDQHVCDICNMKFSQLGGLKGHMRIHTGDKPFQCRYCGICFRLNGTLASHVKKCHHEANPYQCEYCSCQFVTSGVLTQHILKYHPEKSESLEEA